MSNTPLHNLTYDHQPLHNSSFTDVTFVGCRFQGVDFTGSVFSDCVFDHCELILPILTNTEWRSVTFKESKLVGVDFIRCSPHFFRIGFDQSLIDTCNFSSLKLKKTLFTHCLIRESRFIQTVLTEADFSDSDLEGSLFHQCDLEKASFVRAKQYTIDLLANKTKGAIFSLPEAISLLSPLGIVLQ